MILLGAECRAATALNAMVARPPTGGLSEPSYPISSGGRLATPQVEHDRPDSHERNHREPDLEPLAHGRNPLMMAAIAGNLSCAMM
jgi:hypothetical protein